MTFQKLAEHINKQIDFFSYNSNSSLLPEGTVLKPSLKKTIQCLSFDETIAGTPEKDFENCINRMILNTDYYATFLVILSRQALLNGFELEAWKIFALNKSLHSINISPNVELPSIFRLVHNVGTVIGRAKFGNYLFVGHGCTIGASGKSDTYPILGERVSLRANCQILGDSILGDNIIIGSGVTLINEKIPSNTIIINDNGQKKYISSDHPLIWSLNKFNNNKFSDTLN